MSAKNCDNHNRWRNITVGFRVSPEENERLNRAVALSGLPKQEYCYRKCMDNSITVTPNPRIFKEMKTALDDVWTELKRISARTQPSDELMNDITLIAKMLNDMKACKEKVKPQIGLAARKFGRRWGERSAAQISHHKVPA